MSSTDSWSPTTPLLGNVTPPVLTGTTDNNVTDGPSQNRIIPTRGLLISPFTGPSGSSCSGYPTYNRLGFFCLNNCTLTNKWVYRSVDVLLLFFIWYYFYMSLVEFTQNIWTSQYGLLKSSFRRTWHLFSFVPTEVLLVVKRTVLPGTVESESVEGTNILTWSSLDTLRHTISLEWKVSDVFGGRIVTKVI